MNVPTPNSACRGIPIEWFDTNNNQLYFEIVYVLNACDNVPAPSIGRLLVKLIAMLMPTPNSGPTIEYPYLS